MKREPLRPEDYGRFPKFSYVPEAPGTVWARLWPSLLGLLVVGLGVALAPFAGMRRLEVAAR